MFTVDYTVPFEIVALEQHLACSALETFGMKAPSFRTTAVAIHGLKVLALNTAVAGRAQGIVALVVVLGTIRPVVENVEIGGWERRVAFKADKASTMVSTSQTAIRG